MNLRIKAIRMMNFKSFKGEHAIDGLDEHVNAIVGPNGSGKSNVIDCILFVLGYRAKKLRHSALRDIITKGCNKCYVELEINEFTLRRECNTGISDNKDVTSVISSSKNVSTHSSYKINGENVSNSQYIQFLRGNGIDVDTSRFLILQGEIESLSMMGPMELLEYLEECIGTVSMRREIESVTVETEEKKRDVENVANSVQFLEKDLAYKKAGADEKMVWLYNRKGVTEERVRLATILRETAQRRVLTLKVEQGKKRSQLETNRMARTVDETVVRELETVKNSVAQALDESQERVLYMKKEKARYDRLDRKINDIKARLKRNDAETNTNNNNEIISTTSLDEYVCGLRRKLESNAEMRMLEQQNKRDEAEIVELLKQKDLCSRRDNELSACLRQRDELNELVTAIPEESVTTTDLETLRSEIAATREEISRRVQRSEECRRADDQQAREDAVYEAVRTISGVYGSVRMLGRAKPGYETAMEAATPGLGNIVVSTTETAERCIEVINAQKLSRTSFVVLNRIEGHSTGEQGLLGDHVVTDAMFTKVFWHLLGDTRVCNDADEARTVAFGRPRRRVVTLDGQVFEKSGIMSRGRVARKTRGVAELRTTLEKMEGLYEKKRRTLENAARRAEYQQRKEKIEKRLNEIRKMCNNGRSHDNSNSIVSINETIEKIKGQMEERRLKLPESVHKLISEIATKEGELEELRCRQAHGQRVAQFDVAAAVGELEELEMQYAEKEKWIRENETLQQRGEKLAAECLQINGEIATKRQAIDGMAREEAILSNALEDIEESIGENNKMVDKCIAEMSELINEYKMITELIGDGTVGDLEIDNVIIANEGTNNKGIRANDGTKREIDLCETDFNFQLNGLTDEELNTKTKEIVKRVGKEKVLLSVEEIETCRLIFSEFKVSASKHSDANRQLAKQNRAIDDMRIRLQKIKELRLQQFMNGLSTINKHVRSIFSLLTFGGNAELDLVNFLDPFADGVTYNIMPLKKAWKQVSNLSGGERTLASLSFIFALHKYRPSSFYVMDEIDAALDYKNVSLIAQYIAKVDAQFIIISLRDAMYECINSLVGVYKNNGVSQALLLNITDIAKD